MTKLFRPRLLLGYGGMSLQSLMFLLDAKAFSERLEAGSTAAGAEDADHQQLVAIVGKYIRERSPYEVNIESKTKSAIVRTIERATFDELTLVNPLGGCNVYLPPGKLFVGGHGAPEIFLLPPRVYELIRSH